MGKVKSPVAAFRDRQASQGVVRVEVKVRKEDTNLIRQVAAALSDPTRDTELRKFLEERFGEKPSVSLKELLAAAPLAGIDLSRSDERGRDFDL